MLISNFSGNIGNHIFSYAITRTVAEKNNYQWGFNRKPEFDYLQGKEQLDIFDIDYGIEHNYSYYEIPEGYTAWHEQHEDFADYSYQKFQPEVFELKDNTKLFIRCCQDAKYLSLLSCMSWFSIKNSVVSEFHAIAQQDGFNLGENTCIINVRGGYEYLHSPILLPKNYWELGIQTMKNKNSDMTFVCITDDVDYAKTLFPDYLVRHYSIGLDYYILNTAKNLIISNSSFGIMPCWTNKNDPTILAPKFWANYNTNSCWASSDIWTFGFKFIHG